MIVLVNGDIRERSTAAARGYVLATRGRLQAETAHNGERVKQRHSYRQLERTITAEALARTWPYADVEQALVQ
jgi:hypothetical protein